MGVGDGRSQHRTHREREAGSEQPALQRPPIICSRGPLAREHDAGASVVDQEHGLVEKPEVEIVDVEVDDDRCASEREASCDSGAVVGVRERDCAELGDLVLEAAEDAGSPVRRAVLHHEQLEVVAPAPQSCHELGNDRRDQRLLVVGGEHDAVAKDSPVGGIGRHVPASGSSGSSGFGWFPPFIELVPDREPRPARPSRSASRRQRRQPAGGASSGGSSPRALRRGLATRQRAAAPPSRSS